MVRKAREKIEKGGLSRRKLAGEKRWLHSLLDEKIDYKEQKTDALKSCALTNCNPNCKDLIFEYGTNLKTWPKNQRKTLKKSFYTGNSITKIQKLKKEGAISSCNGFMLKKKLKKSVEKNNNKLPDSFL
jgi:hypothetical protein